MSVARDLRPPQDLTTCCVHEREGRRFTTWQLSNRDRIGKAMELLTCINRFLTAAIDPEVPNGTWLELSCGSRTRARGGTHRRIPPTTRPTGCG